MREFTFDIDGDLARAKKSQEKTGRPTAYAYPQIEVPPTDLVSDNFWLGEDLVTLLKRTEVHGTLASAFEGSSRIQETRVMVLSLLGGLIRPIELERVQGDTTIQIPMISGTETPIGILVAANFPAEVSIRNIVDGPFRRSISPLRQKGGRRN